ncbi:MAG: DUF3857 domain-containing protein [Bacteroidia bacterium]|nr:DUF3857 domain-containing protein [Bacteroidia bacterium]
MNKFCFLFALVLFSTTSFAQIDYFHWSYIYDGSSKPHEINPRYANENAYIISEKTIIDVTETPYGKVTFETTKSRIKILTQAGIDMYGRIQLMDVQGYTLNAILARTIKTDGTVIPMNPDELKREPIEEAKNKREFEENYISYSIPNIEIGDEIEMIIGYAYQESFEGSDFFLHGYLPIIKSEIEIRHDSDVDLDVRYYQGLSAPKIKRTRKYTSYSWTEERLKSIEMEYRSIPYLELPYVRIAGKVSPELDKTAEGDTLAQWMKIYNSARKDLLIANLEGPYKENKLNKFLDELWKDIPQDSLNQKMRVFLQYVNDETTYDYLEDKELDKPLYSYLSKSKKIAPLNFYKLMIYALKYADAEAYITFCRAYSYGPFDFTLASENQITEILVSYVDNNNQRNYLSAGVEFVRYELNEIGDHLQGTQAISFTISKNPEILVVTLPVNKPEHNLNTRKVDVNVNFDSVSTKVLSIKTFSGAYSTMYRCLFYDAEENGELFKNIVQAFKDDEENVTLDSVIIVDSEQQHPFAFTVNYYMDFHELLTEIDDNLYSLSIDEWLEHRVDELPETKRYLDYHFETVGIDGYDYYIHFDNDVELVNADKLNRSELNEYCEFILKVNQVDKRTILLTSHFKVKTNSVPNDEIQNLKKIFSTVFDADNEPIVLRKL